MIKFYIQYKQVILGILVLTVLVASFAFSPDGFTRNFLLVLSAGAALVFTGKAIDKKRQKEE